MEASRATAVSLSDKHPTESPGCASILNRDALLKKGEIAREAKRLVEGAGWIPDVFRPEAGHGAASTIADRENAEDAPAAANAVDDEATAIAA